jgi:hypothetical protein
MHEPKALAFLSRLTREQKLRFFAHLCHAVTVAARETYDTPGGVAAPGILRSLNEVQHRLTSVLGTSMADNSYEFPDSFIATVFFGHRPDEQLGQLLSNCFTRQLEGDGERL